MASGGKLQMKTRINGMVKSADIIAYYSWYYTFFIRPTLVKGDSMFPTIKEYNYLIIEKMSYKFGDPELEIFIVFKSESS